MEWKPRTDPESGTSTDEHLTHARVENRRQVVVTWKTWFTYVAYGCILVLALAFLTEVDFFFYLMIPALVILLVQCLSISGHYLVVSEEIRRARKAGRAHRQGSRHSFRHPYTVTIEKPEEP